MLCACKNRLLTNGMYMGPIMSTEDERSISSRGCLHRQKGCSWIGRYEDLQCHLNSNPTRENQLEGCQFTEINCINCRMFVKRREMRFHQLEVCSERPFVCEYCGLESTYHHIAKKHWPVCLVPCPNGCGNFSESNASLEAHQLHHCPLEKISCDFSYFGCEANIPRKDMQRHLMDNAITHLSMMATTNKQKLEDQDLKIKQFESEISENKRTIATLTKENLALQQNVASLSMQQPCCYDRVVPVMFCINNFKQYKQEGRQWYSAPFLSHANGYKLCIGVIANGSDRVCGTHVSLFIHLMQGEFDDQLTWPLQATVKIQLLNQVGERHHHTKDISLDYSQQVTHRKKTGGFGYPNFISHNDLQSKYLKDDCLYLLIANFSRL